MSLNVTWEPTDGQFDSGQIGDYLPVVGGTLTGPLGFAGPGSRALDPSSPSIRAAEDAPTSLSLTAPATGANVIIGGASSVQAVCNGYWTGSAWNRFDTDAAYGAWWVGSGAVQYFAAPAGANPVTGMTSVFSVSSTGEVAANGGLSAAGSLTAGQDLVAANWVYANQNHYWFGSAAWMRYGSAPAWAGQPWIDTSTAFSSPSLLSTSGNLYFVNDTVRFFWNGAGLQGSHYIMSGGDFYWHSNGGLSMVWNGTDVNSSMNFRTGGYLYATGRLISNNWDIGTPNSLGGSLDVAGTITTHANTIYMEGGRNVHLVWNGDAIHAGWGNGISATGLTLSGGAQRFYYEPSRAVSAAWDGTWVRFSHSIATNAAIFATTYSTFSEGFTTASPTIFPGNQINFQDTNARVLRDAETHWFRFWMWGGVFNFMASEDGHTCGRVERGGFANGSDARSKSNIRPIHDGLQTVLDQRIVPMKFTLNGASGQHVTGVDAHGAPAEYDEAAVAPTEGVGFTAQDVAQVIPEVVCRDEDAEPVAINYGSLVAVLWDAVRTLNSRVEELEARP